MEGKTLGQVIDELGVTADSLDADRMITDVIVLAKTVGMDAGDVSLYTAHSDGISWIEKIGMLRAAETIENSGYRNADDD